MKFIKKHLTAIIVTIVCLILMILAAFAVYRMFYPSSDKSVYGDRGLGAPEITNELITSIKDEVNDTKLVNSVEYSLSPSSTTIKFYIDVKEDVEFEDAQEIGDIIVEQLNDDINKFYDMSIYLTQKTGEIEEYPAIGQKAKESKRINWVVDKEVSDSEE